MELRIWRIAKFLSPRSSFTLIELLVVIAIIGVLSVVVILTLNPSELVKQARDSNRLSDMDTLNKAVSLFNTDLPNTSLGTASTTYTSVPDSSATCANLGLPTLPSGWSYHCVASSTLKNIDGTGWIPLNLTQLSYGNPLGSLPVDPVNTTSSRNYYTYTPGGSWELTSAMESSRNKLGGVNDKTSTDGGIAMGLYETGTNKTLLPIDYGDSSLVGWWNFEEGGGTTAPDRSGKGNPGSWNGTGAHYFTGKVGMWAGQFNGSDDYLSASNSQNMTNSYSYCFWLQPSSTATFGLIGNSSCMPLNGGCGNSNNVYIDSTGKIGYFIFNGGARILTSTTTLNSGIWYNVCATQDSQGATRKLFVNGVGEASDTNISTQSFGAFKFSFYKTETSYFPALNYFPGLIDDVRIYSRALSAAEIAAIYNATK